LTSVLITKIKIALFTKEITRIKIQLFLTINLTKPMKKFIPIALLLLSLVIFSCKTKKEIVSPDVKQQNSSQTVRLPSIEGTIPTKDELLGIEALAIEMADVYCQKKEVELKSEKIGISDKITNRIEELNNQLKLMSEKFKEKYPEDKHQKEFDKFYNELITKCK